MIYDLKSLNLEKILGLTCIHFIQSLASRKAGCAQDHISEVAVYLLAAPR